MVRQSGCVRGELTRGVDDKLRESNGMVLLVLKFKRDLVANMSSVLFCSCLL